MAKWRICSKVPYSSAHEANKAKAKFISRSKRKRKLPRATSYFCPTCKAYHWGKGEGRK